MVRLSRSNREVKTRVRKKRSDPRRGKAVVFHFVTASLRGVSGQAAFLLKTGGLSGFCRGRWLALYSRTTSVSIESLVPRSGV